MDASTELNGKLQKISALMGLLRSDLLELSQATDAMQRIPVVAHVNWIADQLDAAGATLSNSPGSRVSSEKRSPTASPAEMRGAKRHTSAHSADRDAKHESSESKDTARPDKAHRDTELQGSDPEAQQPDDFPNDSKTATSPTAHGIQQPDDPRQPNDGSSDLPRSDAASFEPPIPDVPKPKEDPAR